MWEKTDEPKYVDYDEYRPGWSTASDSGHPFDVDLRKEIHAREEVEFWKLGGIHSIPNPFMTLGNYHSNYKITRNSSNQSIIMQPIDKNGKEIQHE